MASRNLSRLESKRDYYRNSAKGVSVTNEQRKKFNRLAIKYEDKITRYNEQRGDINYRARKYSIFTSAFSTLIGVVLVYVLFNFLVDSTFQFDFISFVKTVSNMPLLSLTEIGAWDFPNWLDWLEPLAKGLSILGASLANIAVIAVWLILLLFGVPV